MADVPKVSNREALLAEAKEYLLGWGEAPYRFIAPTLIARLVSALEETQRTPTELPHLMEGHGD